MRANTIIRREKGGVFEIFLRFVSRQIAFSGFFFGVNQYNVKFLGEKEMIFKTGERGRNMSQKFCLAKSVQTT